MTKDVQQVALKRLKIVRGHLDHVVEMIERGDYCIDILQQSLAVGSALRGVDTIILKGHLEEHVSEAMKSKRKKQSIEEIVELFNKARR